MASTARLRGRKRLAIAVVWALVVTVVNGAAETSAAPAATPRPVVQKEKPVDGTELPVRPRPVDPEGDGETAPGLPGPALKPESVPVTAGAGANLRVLGRDVAERAGVDGFLISAARAAGDSGTDPVRVEVDTSAIRETYGGGWASRLRVVQLPGCVLSTPERDGCGTGTPLPTTNEVHKGRLSANVPVAQAGKEDTVLAVAAAPSGPGGDYSATPLSPSAKWQVGPQHGDFSWSYPVRTPPGMGELVPEVGLSYSSGSTDGRTASTNAQPSWIGEGFEYWPGYIERRYKSCIDDGVTPKKGDMCWGTHNATMVLNGSGTELIRDDATGTWRAEKDDGAKVERLTGAVNGDGGPSGDAGEHWRVTTTDGTQYHFGLNRLPGWSAGKAETRSTWTAPVFGDDAGEPCHQDTFAASHCMQAWRWNLDHVVDPTGNVVSYFYTPETNFYARNVTDSAGTQYTRGGYLNRIDYGQRDGQVYTTTAPQRVVFDVAERCLPTATFDCAESKFTAANAANWPDVPFDQHCAGTSCPNRYSPTFWSRKRLVKIRTQVLVGTAHRDVESWTLKHAFPQSGDGYSRALWLQAISHSGHIDGTATVPDVSFDGEPRPNRVDSPAYGPMYRRRISTVINETGGQLTVRYKPVECVSGSNMPSAPDSNTKLCFPQKWQPPEGGDLLSDYFHKHVVESVTQIDRTGGAPDQGTFYEYLGGAAWHYDDNELVPASRKSWSEWRGFERVRIRTGNPAGTGQFSLVEQRFMRGMDGDRLANGSTRDVRVTDSDGVAVEDHNSLHTFTREEITYNPPSRTADGPVVAKSLMYPWKHGPTAKHGVQEAWVVEAERTVKREAKAAGDFRMTEVKSTFDTSGILTRTEDLGDTSTPDDDQCVRHEYARNAGKLMLTYASRVETVSVNCAATPNRPDQVISDVRTYYDGAAAHTTAPTRGLVTRTEEISGWTGAATYATVSESRHDEYGRVIESTDALGKKTTTSYAPATGGPVTATTTRNPMGHVEIVEQNPAWGSPTAEIVKDAAGPGADRRTDLAYDPLGRLIKVWLPGRSKAQQHTPNTEFAYGGYLAGSGGPVAVTTRTLRPDASDGYNSTFELYDGFLRSRQTQEPAPGGGRELTDTQYDSRGLVVKKNGSYFNTAAAGTALFRPADNQVPAQTELRHDGAGRTTAEVFRTNGVDRWSTVYTHGADWSTVDPPAGDTATATRTDARGNVVELRQYHGDAPTGNYDVTTYGYTRAGRPDRTTDPAGNEWRARYDLRGRRIEVKDPDTGTSTLTPDAAGRLAATRDSQGRQVAYTYDDLGRLTGMYKDSTGGTKLAEWTYDTLLKGEPTSSTRFVDGKAYTTTVTGYDPANRTTGTKITIPSVTGEEKLAKTYQFGYTYNADGGIATVSYPATDNLPAEVVTVGYDQLGLPTTLTGSAGYVTESLYSSFGEPLQYVLPAGPKEMWLTNEYEEGTRRVVRTRADRDAPNPQLSNTAYSYDPAGNITRITEAPEGQPVDTQCFRYDHLRRMTQAWTRGTAGTDACAAAPSQPSIGGPAPYWTSFTYDATGNRRTETKHSASGNTTRTYAYPAAGQPQPHTLRSVTTTGPSGSGVDEYGYDNAGNTTSRKSGGTTQTLAWDPEGRLASVTEGGKTTSYVYDAEGKRLLTRENEATTVDLGLMTLRLDKAGNTVSATRYYKHGDAVGVRTSAGDLDWLIADHQGTAELAVDTSTLTAVQRWFGPFGEQRGPAPAGWPDAKSFVGGEADHSTGLVHLGARDYLPSEGRFISADPVLDTSEPQQLNAYAYANNSPVTLSDPEGLFWCWSCVNQAIGKAIKSAVKAIKKGLVGVVKKVGGWASKGPKKLWSWGKRWVKSGISKAKKIARTINDARNKARAGCRVLIRNCDPKRINPGKSWGLGKPLGCDALGPASGRCRDRVEDGIESYVRANQDFGRHISLEGSVCAGFACVSATWQNNKLTLDGGLGVGVPGPSGSIAWNSLLPEEQGDVAAEACAGMGVGYCVNVLPKVDKSGEVVGRGHSHGLTLGSKTGFGSVGVKSEIASWDTTKWTCWASPFC